MTKMRKSKQHPVFKGLVIGYWNLRFICNLVLGICIFFDT